MKILSEENYLQGRKIGIFSVTLVNVIMLKEQKNFREKLAHDLLEIIETWNSVYKIVFNFFLHSHLSRTSF